MPTYPTGGLHSRGTDIKHMTLCIEGNDQITQKTLLGALALALGLFVTATSADASQVTVKKNDTLSGIAAQSQTSVESLKEINHLANVDLIYPGQKLETSIEQPAKLIKKAKPIKPGTAKEEVPVSTPAKENVAKPVQAPAQQEQPAQVQEQPQPVQQNTPQVNDNSATQQIVQAESGGSYTAQNGRFYGRYQLDINYLGGDLSPQHQDQVFQQYVNERYGGVEQALAFRQQHGWY